MITNIIILFWLLLVFFILYLAFKRLAKTQKHPFQAFDKTDVPFITIDIQGKQLNLLVDTGCGISIISKNALENLSYTPSPRKINLKALTDDTLDSETVSIPITVCGKEIIEDFVIYDQEEDMAGFQKHYGITLHGILGNEFFEKTHCKIDYKKHLVTLS